jgi:hypothetical protein
MQVTNPAQIQGKKLTSPLEEKSYKESTVLFNSPQDALKKTVDFVILGKH